MTPFTPAPHHDILMVLFQIAALLLTGRLLGELAQRLGQPVVVGEIFAGIFLGPSLLSGLFPSLGTLFIPQNALQSQLLEFISLIGVLFLLLVTGLEIDSRLILAQARSAFSVAVGGLILPLATGFVLGLLLPDQFLAKPDQRLVFALFLATAMSISAIPVLAKVLMDLGLTRTRIGQTVIVAAMIDDTVGWILLSMVAALAGSGVLTADSVLSSIGGVLAFIILSFTVGRWLVSRARRFAAANLKMREKYLSLVVLFMFAWGALSHAIGLEALLGAFMIGIVFSASRGLLDDILPKLQSITIGVFAPIFFGVVGLKVNALRLLQQPDLMLAAVLIIAVAAGCKIIGVYVGARLLGKSDHWTALFYASGLNARGSMEIIVATIGLSLGVLTPDLFSIIVVMAVVTSVMAPTLLRWTISRIPEAHS